MHKYLGSRLQKAAPLLFSAALYFFIHCCRSVTKSCLTLYDPHELQHSRLSCHSLSSWVCSNLGCPLSWWYHQTISSSAALFSSCPQSFPALRSFPVSRLFISGGQSIGASESAFPMNFQGWFPLGLTGLILLSKRLSRVSSSTVQKHQFFSTQPSLWSNSHIHTWLVERPQLWLHSDLCQQSDVSAFLYAV